MAKDPAFLFYPGDYIAGTMHLDFTCKGAYVDLLMLQFNRGHMTLDMIHHMLGHNCGQLWGQIQDKFKIETINGTEFYFNERLRLEKQKRQLYVKSRVNNIDGTNQHKKKGKKTRGHMTSHMEDENEDKKLRSKIGDEIEDKRGENQDAIKFTQLLFDLIKERKIDFKTPDLNKWAEIMDRIIRIDHRESETIEAVIRWCQTDDFWQDNILSPAKLRKQFDQLEMKMKKAEYMKLPKHTRANAQVWAEIEQEEQDEKDRLSKEALGVSRNSGS
uniref:Uncharacterized protein n=1 Tax=viral metagenome TaxID=1070528 RepID=A0A6M3LFM9_9ZZZZ